MSAVNQAIGSSTRLNWCSYELEFISKRSGFLHSYPGSAVRGAFGHALKKLACVIRNRPCEGCPLEFSCLYTTIFETRYAPDSATRRYAQPPHPFVLTTGELDHRQFVEGDSFTVKVTLIGPAINAAPFILRALEEAAERGFGTGRLPFTLADVRPSGNSAKWSPGQQFPEVKVRSAPPPVREECRWRCATPLRISSNGRLLDQRRMRPADLANAIFRRLDVLARFFGEPGGTQETSELRATAERLRFSVNDLSWTELRRRSARQRTTHSISGLTGMIGFDTSMAPNWRPVLAWASILHVGKGTSMGLGQMETA